MRSLDQLARLQRWTLDEVRQRLARLEGLRDGLQLDLSRIEKQMENEAAAARATPEAASVYPAFIAGAVAQRGKLLASLEELDKSIATTRDELAEAFQETKRYEVVAENHRRRQAEIRAKREQAQLDELGLDPHRRRTSVDATG